VTSGTERSDQYVQIYADVTRLPLSVIGSAQGPAVGSAMHAAVAAGAYPDIHAAAAAMGKVRREALR
jgi:L-ribulokinase